jgi:uncharacterized repeat protein (TIGR01451 family)
MAANAPIPTVQPVAVTVYSGPILAIEKTAAATANPGEDLVYTVRYRNDGTGAAHNVRITESYDANVTFVSSVPSPDSGENVWQIGTLAPGADHTIIIIVHIEDSVAYGTNLVNTVWIDSDESQPQSDSVSTHMDGYLVYVPVLLRGYTPSPPQVRIKLVMQR